jgi:hypothetical protein
MSRQLECPGHFDHAASEPARKTRFLACLLIGFSNATQTPAAPFTAAAGRSGGSHRVPPICSFVSLKLQISNPVHCELFQCSRKSPLPILKGWATG